MKCRSALRHIPKINMPSGQYMVQGTRKAPTGNRALKVISWNLLRLTGAGVADVAALIERHRPDLLLLQEATEELAALPALVGGHFFREPLDGRIYGLAVWSPHPLPRPYALRLPVSQVPGRVPPRLAQIVRLGDIAFANVHLSHGQFLNRWQLLHIANSLDGPAAIVGDYNAVGPIKLAGFKDVGPRQPTHVASNIISFRLDRCMARGLRCSHGRVLARGPSDHHPIALDLHVLPSAAHVSGPRGAQVRRAKLRANVERWLRTMSDTPNRIRVGQNLLEAFDLTLRKAKRGRAQRPHPASASNDNMARRFDDHASQ
jgi:endonuclease/exonuclease/phosphatase (EEP) superfamily protein YafD